ncbi:MAG: Fe2+-dependent dioxygenase [Gammaproteobacteria bacterium]
MIYVEPDLLNEQELGSLRRLYDERTVRDGALTAGGDLATSKNNRELHLGEHSAKVKAIVLEACNRSIMLTYALLPRLVTNPILSLYEDGMQYGRHTDSAMGHDGTRTYRSDISVTVFLDDPSTYEGGELAIENEAGEACYKLPAGHAVFYPTLYIHRVRPVTKGRRRACVFWVESLVRDPAQRAILFDLMQVSSWLGEREPMDSVPRQLLTKVRENLFRMWIEA